MPVRLPVALRAAGPLLVAAGAVAASAGPGVAADPVPAYRLAAGDDIAVTFPDNPELNQSGPIGPDGRFSVPYIDSLRLADETTDEAAHHIATALRDGGIVAAARPSVQVRQYGAAAYVGGEVRQPGAVKLGGPVNVMQAIILAGGMLDTAKTNRVVIIREGADGRPQTHVVDVRAFVKHGRALDDGMLRAHDIVYVPRSSIAEVNLWVDQHINRLLPFSRSLNYNIGNSTVNTVNGR